MSLVAAGEAPSAFGTGPHARHRSSLPAPAECYRAWLIPRMPVLALPVHRGRSYASRRRSSSPPPTLRARMALLYGAVICASGVALLAITPLLAPGLFLRHEKGVAEPGQPGARR